MGTSEVGEEDGLEVTIMAVAILLALFCSTAVVVAEQPLALKPVVVFVEGDSSVIPKFINLCREMGPEHGIDFRFVDKLADKYDYRVVLSAEGSGMWNYAQGNIVILNPEAKVLFTVTRSNRLTAKGATSALTKEFVKALARLSRDSPIAPSPGASVVEVVVIG